MHPDTRFCHNSRGLLLLIALAALTITVAIPAQQATPSNASDPTSAPLKIKIVKIKDVPASSGQKMYVEYCSVCHGTNAKGDGPAAQILQYKPTDLSLLSAKNQGKFPRKDVEYILTNTENAHSRGTADMPVWYPAFRSLNRDIPAVATMRVNSLVLYLEKLQVPNPNAAPIQLNN